MLREGSQRIDALRAERIRRCLAAPGLIEQRFISMTTTSTPRGTATPRGVAVKGAGRIGVLSVEVLSPAYGQPRAGSPTSPGI